jgi:probable rRNA maturation factor
MVFEVDWSGARAMRFEEKFQHNLERIFSRSVPAGKGKRASVSFISSLKMRNLNRMCRGFDRPTDVLSFAAQEGEHIPGADESFAGDIVICLPYVRTSAKEQNVSFAEELVRMFVHGAMHCLGYDHMNPRDAKKMLPLQEEMIKLIMRTYVS